MKKILPLVICLLGTGAALAKLPAASDEAKAKADEAKAKAAWGDKIAAYQLCESQNKVAAYYLKTKGKDMKPLPTPACADPGPYVATAVIGSQVVGAPDATKPAASPPK